MICYVMLCYVMLCHVMLCHVMLCHVMSCHVTLCLIVSSRLDTNKSDALAQQHRGYPLHPPFSLMKLCAIISVITDAVE